MTSVSKNILDLLKVVAENQIQLAKKVDTMNRRLQEFFDEASTDAPVDLEDFSIEPESVIRKKNSAIFDEMVLKEHERRSPKPEQPVKNKKKSAKPTGTSKVKILKGANTDPYDISGYTEDELASKTKPAKAEKINKADSVKEKLRKLGMELPSLSSAIPELADIEKAKVLEAEIDREQKIADQKKPKEEESK